MVCYGFVLYHKIKSPAVLGVPGGPHMRVLTCFSSENREISKIHLWAPYSATQRPQRPQAARVAPPSLKRARRGGRVPLHPSGRAPGRGGPAGGVRGP